MPRISYFYGISIYMYFDDHAPPHFHARYGGDEARVIIQTGDILHGGLPPRALKLVRKWLDNRQAELLHNWEQAANGGALNKVNPLK
ncbi:MAG: DUF4160 domain-containing protein [Rhodothermales bacterium]|nr:DUF4160 domain-containing protein [Rhodothermales bacterium]